MEAIACTVFFEDPFFIAVFERTNADGSYSVAKHTFGAEPSPGEILAFLRADYVRLTFSPPEKSGYKPAKDVVSKNPKRLSREAARATASDGVGTKAQQALKAQYTQTKLAHRAVCRMERDLLEERKFTLRQAKKKAKHRGH